MSKSKKLHEGSVQSWLSTFHLGEIRWRETTLERYKHAQRTLNLPKTRRQELMMDWVFAVALFTGVSNSKAGVIHYLLKIERTA